MWTCLPSWPADFDALFCLKVWSCGSSLWVEFQLKEHGQCFLFFCPVHHTLYCSYYYTTICTTAVIHCQPFIVFYLLCIVKIEKYSVHTDIKCIWFIINDFKKSIFSGSDWHKDSWWQLTIQPHVCPASSQSDRSQSSLLPAFPAPQFQRADWQEGTYAWGRKLGQPTRERFWTGEEIC